ncbi:MAG TPA: radical SAM family heme chaperone HemW [Candidatus Deferrimicrobiaceae bacterium]|jgi:oxygen-independent coproporphyrinogen-3 oxidase
MFGIYVHVPFCLRKCGYCDFYSEAGCGEPEMDRYVDRLLREAELLCSAYPHLKDSAADTIFFGGGTPTALGADRLLVLLASLRRTFRVTGSAEVTVEANPGTVTLESLTVLRRGGFNRLSLGVQSFHPETLELLGRIHGAGEIRDAIRDARRAGIRNVGIDLIFGIPSQTVVEWGYDLHMAETFLPEHLSAYALTPEAGTPLGDALAAGALTMPDETTIAEMYELARRTLSTAGYVQYETSNFARPGRESRHNRKYWRRDEVAALGPAAHGLLFPPGGRAPYGIATESPRSTADWGRNIDADKAPWRETVRSADDAWVEALIAGLREIEGVDLSEIIRRDGPMPAAQRNAVDRLVAAGKLHRDVDRIRIPENMLFLANELLADLV